jgi:hypothetical protein
MRVVAGADDGIWKREYARAANRIKSVEWGPDSRLEAAAVLRAERRSKYRFSKPIAPSNIFDTAPADWMWAAKFVS